MSDLDPAPSAGTRPDPMAATLADALEERAGELVTLWWQLGAGGPTCQSDQAGEEDFARQRYLHPLARLLIGGLRNRSPHRPVYLDERLRYLPSGLDLAERTEFLSKRLAVEAETISDLVAGSVEPQTTCDLLADLHRPLTTPPAGEPLRLLLIGDAIASEIRAFLVASEFAQGRPLDVEHLTWGMVSHTGLSMDHVTDALTRRPPAAIGLSLFSFEAIAPYTRLLNQAHRLSKSQAQAAVADLMRLLQKAVSSIREVTDAPILVHNACGLPLDRLRRRVRWLPAQDQGRKRVIRELTEQTAALVAASENVIDVDEVSLVAANGGLRSCAAPLLAPGDVPDAVFRPTRLGPVLAARYATALAAVRTLGPAKAVLVDFDNTLWAGVMAEGAVVHDAGAQRLLKRLREAGVLLVALSKNNPGDIRWNEMELTPDDFALRKIGWRPKADSAAEAVAELDLSPGSFVLLDDNPAERAMVTEAIPQIAALDPAEPGTWELLEMWLALPSTQQTPEARRRTEMYREAAARRQALAGGRDFERMMTSLHTSADFRRARRSDLDRLVELIQRTSQFNTTTKRRSRSEVSALLQSSGHGVYVASFKDRFGDLGLVAAVIVERAPDRVVVFDSVVMSCRAIGFCLEQLLVRRTLEAEPARAYRGLITPTERNAPSAGLFRHMGFTETSPGVWELESGAQVLDVPEWFKH
jgi:FkbH-like protein